MAYVLFFDGECGFCNKSVRQVYRLDRKGAVEFAPLQGELAARLDLAKHADKNGGTMVILRESDGQTFLRSDGWIELGKALGGVWKILADILAILPKPLRDLAYDVIARNRYQLAGLAGACGVPDEGLRKRMRA